MFNELFVNFYLGGLWPEDRVKINKRDGNKQCNKHKFSYDVE